MQTRRLGSSDICVTVLGFGAAPIGNLFHAVDDDAANAALCAAWDGGVRYFDTAPHYGAADLFVAYFYERFGAEALRKLSDEPERGLVAFDHVLKAMGQAGVDDFFADWAESDFRASSGQRAASSVRQIYSNLAGNRNACHSLFIEILFQE
jgi:aryl-alcohol dehydrogenase-like predicted oxidoreductase